MTDRSKVKPGDEVEVTLRFVAGDYTGALGERALSNMAKGKGFPSDAIYIGETAEIQSVKILPKPFNIGDKAIYTKSSMEVIVLGVDGNLIWAKTVNTGNHNTYFASSLTRKDDCNCD